MLRVLDTILQAVPAQYTLCGHQDAHAMQGAVSNYVDAESMPLVV